MFEQPILIAYIILMMAVITFQLATVLGAPLGEYTLGGYWKGHLPFKWRLLALIQIPIVAFMLVSVLLFKNVFILNWFEYGIWITGALHIFTLLTNLATHSAKEKRLWVPIVSLQILLFLLIVL